MRIIDLELVFRDGSSPVVKTATSQASSISKGENVTYRMSCFNLNGTVRDITGHTFALGIATDDAIPTQIVNRVGSISGAPTLGIAIAVINDGDTLNTAVGTYLLSVYCNDGTQDWQPLPRSAVSILASASLPGTVVTPPGPNMVLVGLPAPISGDVGKFVQLSALSPVTLAFAAGGGGGGSGTVTSVSGTAGLSGTVTTSGNLSLDLAYAPSWTGQHAFTLAPTVAGFPVLSTQFTKTLDISISPAAAITSRNGYEIDIIAGTGAATKRGGLLVLLSGSPGSGSLSGDAYFDTGTNSSRGGTLFIGTQYAGAINLGASGIAGTGAGIELPLDGTVRLGDGVTGAVGRVSGGAYRYNDTSQLFEGSARAGSYIPFVQTTTTQTLTNKTISGASNTLSSIANASLTNSSLTVTAGTGLTGGGSVALGASTSLAVSYGTTSTTATVGNDSRLPPAPSTQGRILYDTGSAWTTLAVGSAGQLLQTNGASANPSWASVGTVPAPGTQGNILYDNGSAYVALAPGTSGQFLKTNGASANPQWAAASGGSVTSVATTAGITGGTITGTGTLSLDLTYAATYTAAGTHSITGIGTAQTAGMTLANPDTATVGVQKFSPMLAMTGSGWGTTGSAAQATGFAIQNRPVQGTVPTTELVFFSSINGGAYAEKMKLDSAGTLTVAGTGAITTLNASSAVQTNAINRLSGGNVTIFNAGTFTCTLGVSTVSLAVASPTAFSGQIAIGRTTVADAAKTTASTDSMIVYTSLSAARVITGTVTGTATNPSILVVKDESGSASGTNTLTFTPASGNIDGAASKVVVNSAYGAARIYCNGTSFFTF